MIRHEFGDCSSKPLGHHTLGIECKSVLSTGVDRMLVGNRVGVGLSRSTISSFAPEPPVTETGQIVPIRPATSHKPSKFAVAGMKITT